MCSARKGPSAAKSSPSSSGRQQWGGPVLCHSGWGVQDQTCRAGSCWGGGCTGGPLPVGTRRDTEGDREPGDSSYRLPFAAPRSGRPLRHHGVALRARSRELGVSKGDSAAAPPSRCPPPQGLTLSPLGPGAPTSPCKEERVRCCTDAHRGAGSTSLETPIPEGPSFTPPHWFSSPQGPLPCLHAPPGSQASPAGQRRVVREGLGWGCSQGWGDLPPGHDLLLAPGAHLHPARRKGREKNVWDGDTPSVTLPWGQARRWLPVPQGLAQWDFPSLVVGTWVTLGGPWQDLPVALGLHARLWLPAARPPAHPAGEGKSSSQPCRVPHHVTGHPTGPPPPQVPGTE